MHVLFRDATKESHTEFHEKSYIICGIIRSSSSEWSESAREREEEKGE